MKTLPLFDLFGVACSALLGMILGWLCGYAVMTIMGRVLCFSGLCMMSAGLYILMRILDLMECLLSPWS